MVNNGRLATVCDAEGVPWGQHWCWRPHIIITLGSLLSMRHIQELPVLHVGDAPVPYLMFLLGTAAMINTVTPL